jgi:predicted dinucleotide-binding enzyme
LSRGLYGEGVRIGMLGTGTVGRTLGGKLVELGHEVRMGSRRAGNEKAVEWVDAAGENASEGTFAEAAEFGELVFNATAGAASLDALAAAGGMYVVLWVQLMGALGTPQFNIRIVRG